MIVVNEKLLDEFRTPGRCEWCGKRCAAREPHHVSAKGMSSGKRLDLRCNLISVGSTAIRSCPCHRAIQGNKDRAEIVLDIVAERENTTPATIQECVWLFQRLPKTTLEAAIEAALTVSKQVGDLFLREYTLAASMGALPGVL